MLRSNSVPLFTRSSTFNPNLLVLLFSVKAQLFPLVNLKYLYH